ncbi:MAG TPA: 5-formyltetrahydrofolate cyclo-ligase [Devosia sp.]|nr:5-formyltetrahydrofolate cyclo-ligase [Devosia sp.]
MADADTDRTKALLREQASARRAALGEDFRQEASRRAAAHFAKDVTLEPGAIVAAYWPMRDEMDCRPLLLWLAERGQPICLPAVVTREKPLAMRLWVHDAPLYPNGFGTLAPADDAALVEPDVVLLPLLAFDRTGTRLGYGAGYYDRTMAALSKPVRRIGYAFAAQEMPVLPRELHDVPLQAVVTEEGIRHFMDNGEAA